MAKQKLGTRLIQAALAATTLVVLQSCGGGGGGGLGGTTTTTGGIDPLLPAGTAKFTVDVATGQVSVVSLNPPKAAGSRAVLAGSALSFESTTLVDQPGNVGRKVIEVKMVNRTGEPIGVTPSGEPSLVRVVFDNLVRLDTLTDIRGKTQVTTAAGTGAAGSVDGPASSATLKSPAGVAVANDGAVYIADAGNHRIRKLQNGQVSTLAGTLGGGAAVDGAGTAAVFNSPIGIAVNPVDGAIIVADSLNNKIRRITPDGIVSTVAGTGVAGSANGLGNVATFNRPYGVAVNSLGHIYLTDLNNAMVRRIILTGSNARSSASYTVALIAGSGAGFADGMGSAAKFNLPRGIAIDSSDFLYVADFGNNRIRRVSPTTEVVTIAGSGILGFFDGKGNSARFNGPFGIAYVNGGLVVSESTANKLRQVTLISGAAPASSASWRVVSLAGEGTGGSANGPGTTAQFATPNHIAASGSGNIYVADIGNQKVRLVRPTNGSFPIGVPEGSTGTEDPTLTNPSGFYPLLDGVSLTGERPYLEYNGPLQPGATSESKPWQFAVPDGVRAFEFTVTVEAATAFLALPDGVSNSGPSGAGAATNMVRIVAGGSLNGFANGSAIEARFNSMSGIAVDTSRNLYIADSGNHSIRRISASGRVSTVAGITGFAGDTTGTGTEAFFSGPAGIAVTPDGATLFVADTGNNKIRRIALTGTDPSSPDSWTVTTVAGSTEGYVDSTDGTSAQFTAPLGIALSSGGVIYVTEFTGNRIRRISPSGADPSLSSNWRVTLVAGSTTGTSGDTEGFSTVARFNLPRGVAVDLAGNLYVADQGNTRVRKISPDFRVSTLAGSTPGYADGVGPAAQFGSIYGVTVDRTGFVFTADDTHRIRRISPAGTVTTVAGGSNTGDVDGPGNVATFYYPQTLAINESGQLFVTTGGRFLFEGGGSSTSPGMRVKVIERILTNGNP